MITQSTIMHRIGYKLMPRRKIQVFVDQFPWIEDHIPIERITEVHVSGIDPEFVTLAPGKGERILLLDGIGGLVTASKLFRAPRRKFIWFGPVVGEKKILEHTKGIVRPGDIVDDVLAALGDKADSIRFALSTYTAECVGSVIVYKAPKDATIDQWLKEISEKKLRSDLTVIDNGLQVVD